jgi:putative molybdopterin biosynthesis protein
MIVMGEKREASYLTPEQVASILNIRERKVVDMLRRKELPGVKIGKEWRIDRSELDAFIERNRNT